ncbi:ribosomal-protein-alanine N-acetyltransferase [Enterococcus sp. PF1-24]|uniref:GNAT family N-acetyltransferase n=1 Tax=unclassified Enterococcus TaxID=2608891 RepID=UPI00247506FE|nr:MULTISPECIES: GNAT family N-acetyltransferase [unclassified Enterococcus]MDH6365420.1 ribosomal-protein-alanine N-acetyltransferase [Enterococcus sp. PFB1-1]MDH6402508.1 ribosomal-protein-alanine N-acetyltransferase [Enterococcus sp. PF1-24]
METQRLYIRPFKETDWQDLYEYLSDEKVVHYEPYSPQTKEECQKIAIKRANSTEFWAVCLKSEDKLIGNIYLAEKEQQNWEIGYVFNRSYQKQGYASEAVKAVVKETFAKDGHRISAYCNPENTDSWKLLERIGFQKEAHLRKNVYFNKDQAGQPLWQDTFIYAQLAAEHK